MSTNGEFIVGLAAKHQELWRYIKSGNKRELMEFLGKEDIDLRRGKSPYFLPPIFYAVFMEKFDVADFLIEHGADLRVRYDDKDIFHIIIEPKIFDEESKLHLVKEIVEWNKEVNRYDGSLNEDWLNWRLRLLELRLLKYDAYEEGIENFDEFKEDILSCINPNEPITVGDLLKTASFEDMVRYLVEMGMDINKKDKDGDRPLHLAIRHENTALVAALLECGANPSLEGKEGDLPLHLAIEHYKYEIVELLLKYGADANEVDSRGKVPLCYAAEKGSVHITELLLEHGADIDKTDEDGDTALHYAARKGDIEIVKLLLRHGADAKCRNENGMTPITLSALKSKWKLFKFFIEEGMSIEDEPIMQAWCAQLNSWFEEEEFRQNIEILDYLISKGISLDGHPDYKHPVLILARKAHLRYLEEFDRRGGNIFATDAEGYTAFSEAMFYRNWEAAEYLFKRGVSPVLYWSRVSKKPVYIEYY